MFFLRHISCGAGFIRRKRTSHKFRLWERCRRLNGKGYYFLKLRLSQNFSFWEGNLRFKGKRGLSTAFSNAILKTNRVLGMVQFTIKLNFYEF
jgi:hypothetical protein